jgi:hypothetical protein
LAAAVDAAAAVAVGTQSIGELQALVGQCATAVTRLDGVISRAVGELQVRGGGQVPDRTGTFCTTPAWLRSAANTTGPAAGRRVRTSVALRELPLIRDAIVDGQITEQHGRQLARLVGNIDSDRLLESQPALLEVARRLDPDMLGHYVRHLLATWCEPALEADEAAAEAGRFFQVRNKHNGSWRGIFDLPDAAMEIMLPVLEALSRRDGDTDTRPAGQRRADALTDVFGLALRHGDLPDHGGSRPRLTFILPAAWALRRRAWVARLGLHPDESPAGPGSTCPTDTDPIVAADRFAVDLDRHPGQDIATGPWTGPATRSQIETMLCEARIERLVLDETGQIVNLTTTTDQITAAQRRAVAARDRCCTTKGCSKPPAFCDVHHLWSRADGGPTDIGNLVLLCRRHHVMWHRKLLDLTDLRVPWLRLPQPRAPAAT